MVIFQKKSQSLTMSKNRNRRVRPSSKGFSLWLMVLGLVLTSFVTQAQMTLEWKCDTVKALLGDVINPELVISSDPEVSTQGLDTFLFLKNRDFEILGQDQGTVYSTQHSKIFKKKFHISFYKTGKFYLPGQSLVYQYNGKELVTTLDSLKIEIFEPTLSDTTKIQPIKPIWEEKRNFWDFLPYILIFLGICAVLYFIYKWWKKRQKKIIDDRWFEEDPNDWFLAKIEEIENFYGNNPAKWKEVYTPLNEHTRRFIYKKTDIPAGELTSEEIIESLNATHHLSHSDMSSMQEVLLHSDLIKYAKGIPEPSDFKKDTAWLKAWAKSFKINKPNHA